MRILLHSISAALAAVLFPGPATADATASDPCIAQPPAAVRHAALRARAPAAQAGLMLALPVDTPPLHGDGGRLRYDMFYNDVAEGWSWQPQARPEDEDYYRWKFLPLQSLPETGQSYVQEDMAGVPQETRVERRDDYFFAFDNPYEFYPRGADGFVVPLPPDAAGASLRLIALARLGEPAMAESTTFWKAVHARPVDFTLKKHYFVGTLAALVVCDARSGRELARLVPAEVQR
ncbi:MAG: hypothetical protein RBT86_03735 [Azospira sp.]|jgi:hypothetical protein|nr:hypothetical protein [Azospira sp.]